MNSFEYLPLLFVLSILPILAGIISASAKRHRELGRFSEQQQRWWDFFVHDLRRYASYRASLQAISRVHRAISPKDVNLLRRAGLSTQHSQTRFLLLRELVLATALVVSIFAIGTLGAEESSVALFPLIAAAIWGPNLWLYSIARIREERFRREEIVLLQVVQVASDRGWSVEHSLHRLAEFYHRQRASNPLANAICRARWYALVGGTLQEGLRATTQHRGESACSSRIAQLAEVIGQPDSKSSAHLAALSSEALTAHVEYVGRRYYRFGAALMVMVLALSFGGAFLIANSFQG